MQLAVIWGLKICKMNFVIIFFFLSVLRKSFQLQIAIPFIKTSDFLLACEWDLRYFISMSNDLQASYLGSFCGFQQCGKIVSMFVGWSLFAFTRKIDAIILLWNYHVRSRKFLNVRPCWFACILLLYFAIQVVLSRDGKTIGFQPMSRLAVNHWASNPLAKALYGGRKISPGNPKSVPM